MHFCRRSYRQFKQKTTTVHSQGRRFLRQRKQFNNSDDNIEIIVNVLCQLHRALKAKPCHCAASPVSASIPSMPLHQPPAPAVLASHLAKCQLTHWPPSDDPASTCTYRDHETPSLQLLSSLLPNLPHYRQQHLHHYYDCYSHTTCNQSWAAECKSGSPLGPQGWTHRYRYRQSRQHHQPPTPPSPTIAYHGPWAREGM